MNETEMLRKVKNRCSITGEGQDELLLDIIEDTEQHFLLLTGLGEVSKRFEFIIKEVASVRYNRISSQGLEQETMGDYSVTYRNPKDDFAPYAEILSKEIGTGSGKEGKVIFL